MLRTLRSVVRLRRPEFDRTTRRLRTAANVDDLRAMAVYLLDSELPEEEGMAALPVSQPIYD